MKNLLIIGMFSVMFFSSFSTIFAEETLPLPEGKNIREWESISVALVSENRFKDALIYLDKILDVEPDNLKALSNKAGLLIQFGEFSESLKLSEKVLVIQPDRVSTLTNKAIALQSLDRYDDAYLTYLKILQIEPDNKNVIKAAGKLLMSIPTIPTSQSTFDVHLQIILRDSNGNLIATTESKNARVLPSVVTERYWDWLKDNGYVQKTKGEEIFSFKNEYSPTEDHLGLISFEGEFGGYNVNFFEVFVPMLPVEHDDLVYAKWTVIRS